MPETLYLSVALLDKYLSLVKIKKNEFQLVGLVSLLLASKYEDFWHPRVSYLFPFHVSWVSSMSSCCLILSIWQIRSKTWSVSQQRRTPGSKCLIWYDVGFGLFVLAYNTCQVIYDAWDLIKLMMNTIHNYANWFWKHFGIGCCICFTIHTNCFGSNS